MTDSATQTDWWGTYEVPRGRVAAIQIGPLDVRVERATMEWRLAWSHPHAPDSSGSPFALTEDPSLLERDGVTRFALQGEAEAISLSPRLADAVVVSRPAKPFAVLPQEAVDVFVSTPLWVAVSIDEGRRELAQIPTTRLSETWFGPSTIEGEIGYASQTAMRVDVSLLRERPHRAISRVSIRNQSDEPLFVDRLNLPVTYLSLFRRPDGGLWTEAITFERPKDGDMVELRLPEPPGPDLEVIKVTGPRSAPDGQLLRRRLGSLFA